MSLPDLVNQIRRAIQDVGRRNANRGLLLLQGDGSDLNTVKLLANPDVVKRALAGILWINAQVA